MADRAAHGDDNHCQRPMAADSIPVLAGLGRKASQEVCQPGLSGTLLPGRPQGAKVLQSELRGAYQRAPLPGKGSKTSEEKKSEGKTMSIFKRGNVYWYHFLFNGEHIQESTKQGNPRTARQIEAAHRTALAKGEVGIEERKAAPMFAALAQQFIAHVEARHENKPQTVQFYAAKLNRLLEYAPIAGARLDRIDEGVIEGYVVARRAAVGPATVNRELATLRRMLRLAHEWREIQRVPTNPTAHRGAGPGFRSLPQARGNLPWGLPATVERYCRARCWKPACESERRSIWNGRTLPWPRSMALDSGSCECGKARARMPAGLSRSQTGRLRCSGSGKRSKVSGFVFANREGKPYLGTSINHLHRDACAPKIKGKRTADLPG